MITLRDVVKTKPQIPRIPTEEMRDFEYDHATQQKWHHVDQRTYKINMKSSTQFDGERDNGGDDA